MTQDGQDIRRLLPVLDMAFQAEQVKMAGIMRRIDLLQQQLADIDRPQGSVDTFDPATRASANILWQTWVQERKKLINRELAKVMAERERTRDGMKRALAKVEAARTIEVRAAAERRMRLDRRS
jgi:hypothetical protein